MARQIFALQILIVLVMVLITVALVYVGARQTQLESARERSVAVAEAVADAPTVRNALDDRDPTRVLQRYAEQVRADSAVDFVVVMRLDRRRLTHPDRSQIGEAFIGDLGAAPQGEVFTQEYVGTLGRSMRAVVPVFEGDEVVALVSAGITIDQIEAQLRPQLVLVAAAALLLLSLGAVGSWLIGRRLRRLTHGLGAAEITRMYEYYDAVLHAVREGLLLVDQQGRVQLFNDEAVRLLGLQAGAEGTRVSELGLPDSLTAAVVSPDARPDELHLVGDFVLVVNQAPALWLGRQVGSVVTLRDHTEIRAVAGELDTVRGFAESLRSQNHEAANRLHTVVSLIEMDRTAEALDFATRELETAQRLTDRVVAAVEEPVVAALLLGKTAQAAERGVDFRITDDTQVPHLAVEPRDVVTVLGNLIDNALDAVIDTAARVVEVRVVAAGDELRMVVSDSGSGIDPALTDRVFERGWSTKAGRGAQGRGVGLALVGQVVRRYDGRVSVGPSDLGGARFAVCIPGHGGES